MQVYFSKTYFSIGHAEVARTLIKQYSLQCMVPS